MAPKLRPNVVVAFTLIALLISAVQFYVAFWTAAPVCQTSGDDVSVSHAQQSKSIHHPNPFKPGTGSDRLSHHNISDSDLPPTFRPIPKLIWSYWHDDNPPTFVRDVIFAWRRFNPDFNITILTRDTLWHHISVKPPPSFHDVIVAHQSDWVRLAVLMEHGGFWLDASLLTTRSLDELRDRQRTEAALAWKAGGRDVEHKLARTEAFQYYISGFTTDVETPVMESWLIATVPRGKYITSMFMEFNFAMANYNVNEGYIEHLRKAHGDQVYEQKIRQNLDNEYYLIILLCSSKVQAIDGIPTPMTENSEDGPNRIQHENGWNDWESAVALRRNLTFPTPLTVKLRGGFRDALIEQLRDGMPVEEGSVYRRFVEGSEAIVRRNGSAVMPVVGIRARRPPELERRALLVRRDGGMAGWIRSKFSVDKARDWNDGIGVGDYGEVPWAVDSKVRTFWLAL
ncbi:hypothetical protein HDU96_004843 [Phlyctochytrium bullatum]|nr:hypothetical protein HDU96_004843 [Phlyctochytrium bullatum]